MRWRHRSQGNHGRGKARGRHGQGFPTLADLDPGEWAQIVTVHCSGRIRHRLSNFGIRRGTTVQMVRSAPLADPLEFSLNGTYISLRRREAMEVEIVKMKTLEAEKREVEAQPKSEKAT